MKVKYKRIVFLILILIWMLSVFGLSNQNATDSSNLSQKIASLVPNYEENKEVVEHVIRKDAHLTEYAIGGVLFLLFFSTYEFSENKKMLYSEMIGVEYAIVDEIHQIFVEGRSCQLLDICIDSIGLGLGICVSMLAYKLLLQFKNKKSEKNIS